MQNIVFQIVNTLLQYISEAPSMVSKAPRTIRRIFRHRLAVENLSRLELHTLVIHILLTRKCEVGKYAFLFYCFVVMQICKFTRATW